MLKNLFIMFFISNHKFSIFHLYVNVARFSKRLSFRKSVWLVTLHLKVHSSVARFMVLIVKVNGRTSVSWKCAANPLMKLAKMYLLYKLLRYEGLKPFSEPQHAVWPVFFNFSLIEFGCLSVKESRCNSKRFFEENYD